MIITFRGRTQLQLIEWKHSTDGSIQEVIDHVYIIYEPLKQALQTHSALKAGITTIPIVISRTGTFNVKTLAEIAQFVFFKEEPPDALTYKQLTRHSPKIALALHVHAQEWLSQFKIISMKILATITKSKHKLVSS